MIAVFLMIATAIAAVLVTQEGPNARRLGWALLSGGLIGWLLTLAWVVFKSPMEWGVTLSPLWAFGVSLNVLTVVMATMVFGLGGVVMRFSHTYLTGEADRRQFVIQIGMAVIGAQLLAVSATLPGIWLAWILTSWMLHRLLMFGVPSPTLKTAARAKWVIARFGDILLGLSFVGIALYTGTTHVSTVLSMPIPQSMVLLLTLGLVVRAAIFPLWTWLVYSIEAPTPVSALLHAGILNAGPFLLMRFFPIISPHGPVLGLCVGIGAMTAIGAALASMTQPSIKGMLAYSSAAHMGFMIFMIGLGGVGPAFIHLLGHSIYKAQAFLGSGQAIYRWRRLPDRGEVRDGHYLRVAGVLIAVTCGLGAVGWRLGASSALHWGLLIVLGLGLATFLTIGILEQTTRRRRTHLALGVIAICVMFALVETLGDAIVTRQFSTLLIAHPPSGVVLVSLGGMIVTTISLLLGIKPSIRTWLWLRNGLGVNPRVDQLFSRYTK